MEAPPTREFFRRQSSSARLVEGDGGKSGDYHFAGAHHQMECLGSKVSCIGSTRRPILS
jgi:hypothetical protein